MAGFQTSERGGQPGHIKHERSLLPSADCDQVQMVKPTHAGGVVGNFEAATCAVAASGLGTTRDQADRHRVSAASVALSLRCIDLRGAASRRAHESSWAAIGRPVALSMGCFRQSKSRVALFLEQVLGQPCSTGWVVKLQNQATAALRPAYEELAEQLPHQPVLGIDETPTKEATHKSWLWTFVGHRFTVLPCATRRCDGRERSSGRFVPWRGELRSGQDVLVFAEAAMVLG